MGRKKKTEETVSNHVRYRYEGYEYLGSATTVDDTYTVEHRVVEKDTGKVLFPDFTSYCFMSRPDFEKYIQLGFPCRTVEYRPLSSNDLRILKKGHK